jgi:hypothetical protein
MRKIQKCIFCKQDSTNSQSVEHIIPESLGNEELILDKGVVCDKCNNYFSREIEGPVLNLDGFRQLRFYELIESKRGRIPNGDALFFGEKCDIHWQNINDENCLMIGLSPETIYKFMKNPPKMFFTRGFELNDKEHEYDISRFLLKIAIEYYVYLILKDKNSNSEEMNLEFDEQLEKLIRYVRVGRKDKKPIKYKVSTLDNYKPMSNDAMSIQICFLLDSNDLIFNLVICDTSFKLNLSKAIF